MYKISSFRLKSGFTYASLSDGRGLLWAKGASTIVEDKIQAHILKRLGPSTLPVEQLLEDLPPQISEPAVLMAVLKLLQTDVVTQDTDSNNPSLTAYWESHGMNTPRLQTNLKESTIAIISGKEDFKSELVDSLEDLGLRVGSYESSDLVVVILDQLLQMGSQQIEKCLISGGKPWLLIQPYGSNMLIGPIFSSLEGVCWTCFKKQWLSTQIYNHPECKGLADRITRLESSFSLPTQIKITTSIAAIQVIRWLYVAKSSPLRNSILEVDPFTGINEFHMIRKRPQCPACGDPTLTFKAPKPINIQINDAQSGTQIGYRTEKPENTLEKFQHLVSPLTGVLPYLRRSQGPNHSPINNYVSGRNMALQSHSLFWLNMHLRSGNGGKGKSDIQAKVGALCEAIERYCMVFSGEEYSIRGSLNSLMDAIHPNDCMKFSEHQFRNRDMTNSNSHSFYSLVPKPFDSDELTDWTPVFSLSEKKIKYLPSCFCYAQYPAEDELQLYSYPDSNGCAAGNTKEEAILQGFLELVERDAVAIWWYNRLQYPGVDISSAQNPYLDQCIEFYQSTSRTLTVIDITSDLGIPVFVAISQNMAPNKAPELIYAFGSHVEASIAIERAVIELNQLLPATQKNKSGFLTKDPVFRNWLETARIEELPYLDPSSTPEKNLQVDYPPLCLPTINDSIHFCIETANSLGLETLVLDLTQPDLALPVVKVIVPGLRHMWRRTAPGRLYDVPVKMGLLTKPLDEENLNPIGIFI